MDHSQMAGIMASNPYGQAEMDMQKKMMVAKRGGADGMWTRKLVEHHGGAIAMARVAQREAKDSKTRQMAGVTITKQKRNIQSYRQGCASRASARSKERCPCPAILPIPRGGVFTLDVIS